jgi:hypothetical protein
LVRCRDGEREEEEDPGEIHEVGSQSVVEFFSP